MNYQYSVPTVSISAPIKPDTKSRDGKISNNGGSDETSINPSNITVDYGSDDNNNINNSSIYADAAFNDKKQPKQVKQNQEIETDGIYAWKHVTLSLVCVSYKYQEDFHFTALSSLSIYCVALHIPSLLRRSLLQHVQS